MKDFVKFVLDRAIRILVGGTMAAMAWVSFIIVGPTIESKYFPVAVYSEISSVRENSVMFFNALYDKIRPCEYVGTSWYVKTPDGTLDKVKAFPPDDSLSGQDRTRPLGRNYMRDWEIKLPMNVPADSQTFAVLHHRCGLPWLTQTKIGPWPVPDKIVP